MSPDTSPPTLAPEPNPAPVVKAAVLAQALPYMRRYAGHTLVAPLSQRPCAYYSVRVRGLSGGSRRSKRRHCASVRP